MQQHVTAFADMRTYYNDVTASNLGLIKALRDDAAEGKRRDAATAKLVAEVAAENRRLVEPLAQVSAKRQLGTGSVDCMALGNTWCVECHRDDSQRRRLRMSMKWKC